jgi:outer membrane protein assembly factor BamB
VISALALLLLASITPAPAAFLGRDEASGPARPVRNWPSFRGPAASGIAEGYATPATWNVEQTRNVQWKTPIPGLGHSSPIVWGDRVFVTGAISGQEKPQLKVGLYGDVTPVTDDTVHQWKIYCLDRKTGRIVWERTAHTGVPKIKRHPKSTQANSTPATDGKSVVVFFGSEGLYCYDFKGKLRWQKDLGVLDSGWFVSPSAQWGFGSSPVIHDGMVLVQCDVQRDSFLAAFSLKDGREIWRTPRADVPTWSTPTVYQEGDHGQLIVNGYKQIGGYDLRTGKELWRLQGGGDIPVPTPVVAHGLIFISNAHGRMSPIYAIRVTATGDLTPGRGEGEQPSGAGPAADGQASAAPPSPIAWSRTRDGSYIPTPLVYGDHLYVCRDNGVLCCYEAKTGNPLYKERLGTGQTGFSASPVAADGKLYLTSEDGDVYVVRAGPKFEVLAVNSVGEICMATPAIAEGTLFFRTQGHLVAIAEQPTPKVRGERKQKGGL